MSLEESQRRLKSGRNDACPCGSGKKYKKCHCPEDESIVHAELARLAAEKQAAAAAERDDDEASDPEGKPAAAGPGRARPDQRTLQGGAKRDRSANPKAKNLPRRRAV
jgi:hypothetical protein